MTDTLSTPWQLSKGLYACHGVRGIVRVVWAQAWPEGMAGIELKVNGFSHKLPLLLDQLVQALVGLKACIACSSLLICKSMCVFLLHT